MREVLGNNAVPFLFIRICAVVCSFRSSQEFRAEVNNGKVSNDRINAKFSLDRERRGKPVVRCAKRWVRLLIKSHRS